MGSYHILTRIYSINILTCIVNYNNCNHKGPSMRKTRESESIGGNVTTEARGQRDARKQSRAKECEKPLESEKDKKMDLPSMCLEGT